MFNSVVDLRQKPGHRKQKLCQGLRRPAYGSLSAYGRLLWVEDLPLWPTLLMRLKLLQAFLRIPRCSNPPYLPDPVPVWSKNLSHGRKRRNQRFKQESIIQALPKSILCFQMKWALMKNLKSSTYFLTKFVCPFASRNKLSWIVERKIVCSWKKRAHSRENLWSQSMPNWVVSSGSRMDS